MVQEMGAEIANQRHAIDLLKKGFSIGQTDLQPVEGFLTGCGAAFLRVGRAARPIGGDQQQQRLVLPCFEEPHRVVVLTRLPRRHVSRPEFRGVNVAPLAQG